MAGVIPPIPPVPPAAAGAPQNPGLLPDPNRRLYREWYSDLTRDPFIGNYGAIYTHYAITPANTPAVVRERVLSAGTTGIPLAHLLLIRPVGAPANNPGAILGYRAARYTANLIQPTGFDQSGFAFLGEVHQGQAPASVVWANEYFNRAPDLNVPTAAYLDVLLQGQPDYQTVGPFPVGDADTEVVQVRNSVFIPSRYMAMFLDDELTPRAAWERLRGSIVTNGDAAYCAPLLDWLRCTITLRNAQDNASQLAQPVPSAQPLANLREADLFNRFRANIVHTDFPDMGGTALAIGAQQISLRIGQLAEQQRLTRESEEAARSQAANKVPSDLFTTGMQALLRWSQVPQEDQLPPIYHLAANAKKGDRRRLLQTQVSAALDTLGYQGGLQISLKLANKFFDLQWASLQPDDLLQGIHLFTLGFMDEDISKRVRELSEQADIVAGGGANPSFQDTVSILQATPEIYIARTLSQLRRSIEQSHAFWHVALGAGHPRVEQHRNYYNYLVAHQTELEKVQPRDASYRHLVPALLQRRVQIDENIWLCDQQRQDAPLAPPDVMTVFYNIRRRIDWAPPLPASAFDLRADVPVDETSVFTPATLDSSQTGSIQSQISELRTLLRLQGGTARGGTVPSVGGGQQVVRNESPSPAFQRFKEMGVRTQVVKARCTADNIT